MGYLAWLMDTDIPLGLGVKDLAAKPGSGAEITGVMTLSNDDEWKEKAPLTSMYLQMDTELQMDLALVEPLPNVDLGQRSLVSDDSKH